jgi:hypothetical protein
VVAPAPKPSAFDVVFGLVDGLARSIVWLALMAVLLLLVAIGLLIAGVVTWVSASAILNLQDWAAWAVTIFVEACAVILIVGYARK